MAESFKRTLTSEFIFRGERTAPGTAIEMTRIEFDRAVEAAVVEKDESRDAEVAARFEAQRKQREEQEKAAAAAQAAATAAAAAGTAPAATAAPANRRQRFSGGAAAAAGGEKGKSAKGKRR